MSWDPRPAFKRGCARLLATLGAIGSGILKLVIAAWNGFKAFLSAVGDMLTVGGRAIGYGGLVSMRFIAALLQRHLRSIAIVGLTILIILAIAYLVHHFTHHVVHRVYRPPPPNAWERWFARDLKDSANGDFYYLVNIFFIPFQTVLVLVGGLVAWRTLGQGNKFKQYDVESSCIKEYLDVENRLAEAEDADETTRAARQYWVLMLYEYYWWRQDLLSRAIFTNWCEFRRQRFAKNDPFGTPDAALPFDSYLAAYFYFRRKKVFPKKGPFDQLMRYLIRHRHRALPITWYEIESFRHGFRPPI
jgi:hypothetical protein